MKTTIEYWKILILPDCKNASFRNLQLRFPLSSSFSMHQSISFPFNRCVFFEKIKVLHPLLGNLEFSKKWWKKEVPMYTTVVAYIASTQKAFLIYMKLLAIIPNMQNHPHLIILNQKINANTKSPILLTQLALQHQFNCNTNATIIILSHKMIVKTHIWRFD